jgi:hypothetical protein
VTSLSQTLKERTSLTDPFGHRPDIFRLAKSDDRDRFEQVLATEPTLRVSDTLTGQLEELWRCRNPGNRNLADATRALSRYGNETERLCYGVWVYYPWSARLVHLLDEAEFVEVRTNRNQLRITREEQKLLETKTIGVLGLSVGSAIAVTLAIERCCGALRLADFDTLELSNLNRIRAPVHALNTSKALFTAREIAELDPFLEVSVISAPIDTHNLDHFLLGPRRLDLCIEECDDLALKILVRRASKQHHIPVLMETNDRGMLDVERYDRTPEWPLLHGLLSTLEGWDMAQIHGLSDQQKIPYVMDIVGSRGLSSRTRSSLDHIGKTLKSWPQLASAVTRGAGVAADMARQILLNHSTTSGRFYSILSPLSCETDDTAPPGIAPPKQTTI